MLKSIVEERGRRLSVCQVHLNLRHWITIIWQVRLEVDRFKADISTTVSHFSKIFFCWPLEWGAARSILPAPKRQLSDSWSSDFTILCRRERIRIRITTTVVVSTMSSRIDQMRIDVLQVGRNSVRVDSDAILILSNSSSVCVDAHHETSIIGSVDRNSSHHLAAPSSIFRVAWAWCLKRGYSYHVGIDIVSILSGADCVSRDTGSVYVDVAFSSCQSCL